MHTFPAENLIVIAMVSSHHVAITLAALDPRVGEEPKRHKEFFVRWSDMDHAGRVNALRDALEQTCRPVGIEPSSIFIACSDPSLSATSVTGWAALGEDVQISEHERAFALGRARTHATADDREQLDVVPTHWVIRSREGQVDCDDPVGLVGNHLTCHAMRVTARRGLLGEFRAICDELGLHLEGLIPQPIALYRGIAGRMHKAGTQLVVDLGARHTTLIVRRKGRLLHMETHPFGGDTVSDRIAVALGVDVARAEEIKRLIDIDEVPGGVPDGQQSIFGEIQERQRQLSIAARAAAEVIGSFFRDRARQLRDEGDLLSQRGQVHIVGRGANIGGLVPFLSDVFRLDVILGTGTKSGDPGAELDGLLVAGVVKCAADRRIEHLVEHAASLRGAAGGLVDWLTAPLT
ncbi:MAG: cell division FtsA domain-containing protein [Planctomycetota bacterium]